MDVDILDKLRSLLTYAFGLLEVGLAVSMATPLAMVAILPLMLLYARFQVWRTQSPDLAEVFLLPSVLPHHQAGRQQRIPTPPCSLRAPSQRPCPPSHHRASMWPHLAS